MPKKENTGVNGPKKGSDASKNSKRNVSSKLTGQEDRYEGYDESRTSHNPSFQDDFDVDETHIDQRKDEYKDYAPGDTNDNL